MLGESIYLTTGKLNLAILLYLRVAETVLFLQLQGWFCLGPSLQGEKCIGSFILCHKLFDPFHLPLPSSSQFFFLSG